MLLHRADGLYLVVDEALTRHVGGLGKSHDVKDGRCDVGQTTVFHRGRVVVGHIDERDGIE